MPPRAQHRAPRPGRTGHALVAAGGGPLALAALGALTAMTPAAQAMTPAAIPASTAAAALPSAATLTAATGTTYTVKAGDTLAGIARANSVPGGWQAIRTANPSVGDGSRIYPGQRLVLPGAASGSSSTGSASPGSSSTGSSKGTAVVAAARTYLGVRYVWGGMSRRGVDCSGLTSLVLTSVGYSPPRTSRAQYSWSRHLTAAQAQPGDLVFSYFSGGVPGHVGIYLGGGRMIDAPVPGQVVGNHAVPRGAAYGRPV